MLTNLAHLDSLRVRIVPLPRAGHTTFRLANEPAVEVVWTYAGHLPDGGYRHVGNPDQGAFNADDIARAAVVYLRHWWASNTDSSRVAARELLRGLCFLQNDTGNVVLWMQPDGRLNPSGRPIELPDPSDSDASAWLARTIWALGEGYAAFRDVEPDFAAFVQARLRLAVSAVCRQVLPRYGQWRALPDGTSTPAWLIGDGADVTGEALLGLSAYIGSSGDEEARKVLDQLTEGVAAMRTGTPWTWPYGAVLPWALSRGAWHAWAGLAPAGLARSYQTSGDPAARDAALADAASFTPHLLAATGPDNASSPDLVDRVQIAYGAQSRLESLLATARATGRPGLALLAGIAGSWFFGNNPAGAPMYDPATGRTYDGIDVPGIVHRDSGAESTIHGLLAMLALDGDPAVAAVARIATVRERSCTDGIERLALAEPGTGNQIVLLRSHATGTRDVRVPGNGPAEVSVNDPTGLEMDEFTEAEEPLLVPIEAGGFTVVRRFA